MSRGGRFARILGIGVTWSVLWLALWAGVLGVIAVADPDSVDPGEPMGLLNVFAPMGLLTGLAFALLASREPRGASFSSLRFVRAVGWGVLATAMVQILYLGHGDAGLVANLGQALMISVGGGLVTAAWWLLARRLGALRGPRVSVADV